MVEVKRTLVKSIPELWEIVDGPELIGRLSAELFRSRPVEVVEREPGTRLAWRVSATPPARVELALAENDWGTRVVIRVERQDAAPEFTGAALKRLLGDLGSDRRPPLPTAERVRAQVKRPGLSRVEGELGPRRSGGGVRPRSRNLDALSVRVVGRARDQVERALQALEQRLADAEEAMRIPGAEDRHAKRAVESFARFERQVGRLQERARRVVATAAAEEVDRRLEWSITPMLREIEARLTDTVRGSADARRAAGKGDGTGDAKPGDRPGFDLIVPKAPTGIEPV
jgi:hypothetical protein